MDRMLTDERSNRLITLALPLKPRPQFRVAFGLLALSISLAVSLFISGLFFKGGDFWFFRGVAIHYFA